MSFHSILPIKKHLIKNRFLFIFGVFTLSSSLLLAQEEKALPPTPLTTNANTSVISITNVPFSSVPTLPPTSNIASNALSHSIPLVPGSSSESPKVDSTSTRPLPSRNPSVPSSAIPRSPLPPRLTEPTPTSPSFDNKADESSTNNAAAIAAISNNPNEKISIQFPHTSILEALSLYEKLTGKRIIRDSNLAGPELSLMIADPVSKKDAVSLLESTMLVNGYTLVPVDEKTIKIIGPSRPPRMEGLPLYQNPAELPNDGERLVSFYQPLHFLSPNEAINILQGVIQINPYGSLVAVPNTSAIVITDKTPVIQKALALLQIIDREPSQIITEFIPLQRADAEKTVETLNQIFGKGSTSSTPQPPKTPNSPYQQQPPTPTPSSSGDEETRIFSGKVQFIPDKRTNRILLVTKAENYRYIRELISKLDQAVQFEEPLVRPLNYVSVSDVFPVLVDLLKNKDDESQNNAAKPQSTPQNPFANNNSNNNSPNNSLNSTGGSSGATGATGADLLSGAPQLQPPQSAIIGSSSLIGDPTANSIIVYGPPESKIKARQIIDLLDHRPQQVYLAAVIGEMKLEEGMDYGASYLFHYQGFNSLINTFGSEAAPALFKNIGEAANLGGGAIKDAAAAAGAALNGAGGLTLFGSIGGSLDVYTKFLESTGKFRTISRPTVYTSNNRKATILSGQKIPYVSSSLTSVVAGSVSTNTANSLNSNVTYQDVLLKLEVIPLINSDKEINLIIAQQNQTVDESATIKNQANQIYAPTVNTQQLTTSVRIPNGSTIVLGGLIADQKDVAEKGIPLIKDIPIIGPLLGGSTHKVRARHELVVMIQPIVVDSNFSMQKASDTQGAESTLGKRARELESKLKPTPTPNPKKKKFQLFHLKKPDDF